MALAVESSQAATIITFADENVKALCVANWDTDKDGELSVEEAAAVTSLGTVFRGQKNITTFDELRYFSSVTAIGEEAFRGSGIGPVLTIPGKVKEIGSYAFNDCVRLKSVVLEEGVESVGWHAFSGPIATLTLPSSLKNMRSMVINPYVNADPSSGIFVPVGDLTVIVRGTEPAVINEFAFYYVFQEAHLVVPAGTMEAYKAEPGWAYFADYTEVGDCNRDGRTDIADVAALVAHVTGNTPERFEEHAADINGDGRINGEDVSQLCQYLLGS